MANRDYDYWHAQWCACWGCIGDFIMFDIDNTPELLAEIDAAFDTIQVSA